MCMRLRRVWPLPQVAPRVLGSPLKLMRAAVAAISGGDATAQPVRAHAALRPFVRMRASAF
eukprot:6202876-Pleurochrysis_carterae.AAC.1